MIFNIIRKAGTLIGKRKTLNFIEGTNVTISVSDNAINDRIDITVNSTGGGGGGNFGTATINFGAFPGSHEASVVVTGQTGILNTSKVQAWLFPTATADHSSDEHIAEFGKIKLICSDIVVGTGFTIRAFYEGMQDSMSFPSQNRIHSANTTTGNNYLIQPTIVPSVGGDVPKIYGQWTVQWTWG